MQAKGYGSEMNAEEIWKFLEYVFHRNDEVASKEGRRGTPICVWGTHGMGKTQLITEIAKKKGWKLAYCAPAQFEEMGDLHGMPEIVDPTPGQPGDEFTIYRPPEWVPKDPGPGILLLDDFNRADDRILRGLMQLLQNFELFSWQLPQGWQIVATANPENEDYSVTPLDDAMITRMLHVTLVFDVKIWANWAIQSGVDVRGIDFVLAYPELVTGKRTTPRTLMQFFDQIRSIENLKKDEKIVSALAHSALDPETADAFVRFVNEDLYSLLQADEIMNAEDPNKWSDRLKTLSKDKEGVLRIDRISTILNRIIRELSKKSYKAQPKHGANLKSLFLSKMFPKDLLSAFYREVQAIENPEAKEWLVDPKIAEFLLSEK